LNILYLIIVFVYIYGWILKYLRILKFLDVFDLIFLFKMFLQIIIWHINLSRFKCVCTSKVHLMIITVLFGGTLGLQTVSKTFVNSIITLSVILKWINLVSQSCCWLLLKLIVIFHQYINQFFVIVLTASPLSLCWLWFPLLEIRLLLLIWTILAELLPLTSLMTILLLNYQILIVVYIFNLKLVILLPFCLIVSLICLL